MRRSEKVVRDGTGQTLKDALLAARRRTVAGRRGMLASGPPQAVVPATGRRTLDADVFISYAHSDRRHASRLARHLGVLGFRTWWDRRILPAGEYRTLIGAALDQARAVVVIWSEAARGSHFVLDEATLALRARKLLPMLAPGSDETVIPLGFGQLHTIRFNASAELARGLQALGARRRPQFATSGS